MNTIFDPIDAATIAATRNTYSARLLTDPQFEEFISICIMLRRENQRSGSFIEKLGIYAFVISLTEKGISVNRAENIIRDLFKCLFGQTLDQFRQSLLRMEEALGEENLAMGVPFAYETLNMIEAGDQDGTEVTPVPFHRAYAHQASILATQLLITDLCAKKLMSEQFEKLEGRSFYDEGKLYEERYYQPKILAEKRERLARKTSNCNNEVA